MPAMKAQKLYHRRQIFRNGLIEMVIWRLPQTDAERPRPEVSVGVCSQS